MALRLASISRCFFASAAAFSRALRWISRSFAAALALASRSFVAFAAATALALAAAALALAAALAFASRSLAALAAAAALALAAAAFFAAAALSGRRWVSTTFFVGLGRGLLRGRSSSGLGAFFAQRPSWQRSSSRRGPFGGGLLGGSVFVAHALLGRRPSWPGPSSLVLRCDDMVNSSTVHNKCAPTLAVSEEVTSRSSCEGCLEVEHLTDAAGRAVGAGRGRWRSMATRRALGTRVRTSLVARAPPTWSELSIHRENSASDALRRVRSVSS